MIKHTEIDTQNSWLKVYKAMSWSDIQGGGTYQKGEGYFVARQKGISCNVEAGCSNKAGPGERQRLDIFMRK